MNFADLTDFEQELVNENADGTVSVVHEVLLGESEEFATMKKFLVKANVDFGVQGKRVEDGPNGFKQVKFTGLWITI